MFALSSREAQRSGPTIEKRGADQVQSAPGIAEGIAEGIDENWAYTLGRSVTDERGRLIQSQAERLSPAIRNLFVNEIADIPDADDPPVVTEA